MTDKELPKEYRVIDYPFHLGDLVGGTAHLDNAQFGAYMRLLIANIQAQAKDGGLPDNDTVLQSYSRTTPAAFKKLWLLIGSKFTREGCVIYHPRVKKTVLRIIKNSEVARNNALIRWDGDDAGALPPDSHGNTNLKPSNLKPKTIESLGGAGGFSEEECGDPAPKINGIAIGTHFDILHHVSEKAMAKAKENAPGWDIYHLAIVYNQRVNSGERAPPDYPNTAFPRWCGKYINGKPNK